MKYNKEAGESKEGGREDGEYGRKGCLGRGQGEEVIKEEDRGRGHQGRGQGEEAIKERGRVKRLSRKGAGEKVIKEGVRLKRSSRNRSAG